MHDSYVLQDRAKTQMNVKLNVADSAKQFLVDQGYDPKYGARALKRKVQTLLEDEMAEEALSGNMIPGSTVNVKASKDATRLVFTVRRKKVKETTKQ